MSLGQLRICPLGPINQAQPQSREDVALHNTPFAQKSHFYGVSTPFFLTSCVSVLGQGHCREELLSEHCKKDLVEV